MTAPMPPQEVISKQQVLLNLLEGGDVVKIYLDPRAWGAAVPIQFQKEHCLILDIGYYVPKPIPDLDIGEDGVGATLSFGGQAEYVFVPWEAVFGMSAGVGSIQWPSSMPPEVRALMAAVDQAAPAAAPVSVAAGVIDLMSRRTPKDARAVRRRMAGGGGGGGGGGAPVGGSAA